MFEMLGNQLFMVRNYPRAAEMFEQALSRKPKDKAIRRRLIVCYTQTGAVEKALDLFVALCEEDAAFIINTDPQEDDCPCPELVDGLEKQKSENPDLTDVQLMLGMLWLYCDAKKSLAYFQLAAALDPANHNISTVIVIIKHHLRQRNQNPKDPAIADGY